MYHITQPIEAHAPKAAADPGSDPNTAGEEDSPPVPRIRRTLEPCPPCLEAMARNISA